MMAMSFIHSIFFTVVRSLLRHIVYLGRVLRAQWEILTLCIGFLSCVSLANCFTFESQNRDFRRINIGGSFPGLQVPWGD